MFEYYHKDNLLSIVFYKFSLFSIYNYKSYLYNIYRGVDMNRIKQLREELKISQNNLAKKLNKAKVKN